MSLSTAESTWTSSSGRMTFYGHSFDSIRQSLRRLALAGFAVRILGKNEAVVLLWGRSIREHVAMDVVLGPTSMRRGSKFRGELLKDLIRANDTAWGPSNSLGAGLGPLADRLVKEGKL